MSKTVLAVNKVNSVVGSFHGLGHSFSLGRTDSTALQGNIAVLKSVPKVAWFNAWQGLKARGQSSVLDGLWKGWPLFL